MAVSPAQVPPLLMKAEFKPTSDPGRWSVGGREVPLQSVECALACMVYAGLLQGEFYHSLLCGVQKYGSLTENQLKAVQKAEGHKGKPGPLYQHAEWLILAGFDVKKLTGQGGEVRAAQNKEAGTELEEVMVVAEVKGETAAAFKLDFAPHGVEAVDWFPKSQMQDVKREGSTVMFRGPTWLLKKKGVA